MDSALVYFPAGNTGLTRRVKKLAEDAGVQVTVRGHWNKYGYQVEGYETPTEILAQARAEIAARRAKEDEKARKRQEEAEKRQEQERQARRRETAAKYPTLLPEHLDGLVEGSLSAYDRADDVPSDLYTTTQWQNLGYRVENEKPRGLLLKAAGKVAHKLYPPWTVRPLACRQERPTDELWSILVAHFGDGELALAKAVWVANRLIKLDPAHKREFYPLKDSFLAAKRGCLVEGRVARVETRSCWGYFGTCDRCCGDGIYSSSTLYEHHLRIASQDFCFHSYTRPASLSEAPGADLPSYGRRFTAQELRALPPLRLADYMRVLRARLGG
jgi:hypothetical protein